MEDTVDQAHGIVPCALADIIEDARWYQTKALRKLGQAVAVADQRREEGLP